MTTFTLNSINLKTISIFLMCMAFPIVAHASPKADGFDMGDIEENKAIIGYTYDQKEYNSVLLMETEKVEYYKYTDGMVKSIAAAGNHSNNFRNDILKVCPAGSKCKVVGDIQGGIFLNIKYIERLR